MATYNFSYTVATGVHFCEDCLCKLSDLKKGGTHNPHPLAKYEEFSPDKMKFEMRCEPRGWAWHIYKQGSAEYFFGF